MSPVLYQKKFARAYKILRFKKLDFILEFYIICGSG